MWRHLVGASPQGRANIRAAAGRERCSAEIHNPVRHCWQRQALWVANRSQHEEVWHRGLSTTGGGREPTGVGSTARMDSAPGKVGKFSQVAEALPHGEGAGYKRQGREIPVCPRDRRMRS